MRLEQAVEDLVDKQAIQKAVSEALHKRGPVLPLGWLSKLAVAAVTVSAVAGVTLQIVYHG